MPRTLDSRPPRLEKLLERNFAASIYPAHPMTSGPSRTRRPCPRCTSIPRGGRGFGTRKISLPTGTLDWRVSQLARSS